jgi:hypothetical protein
MWKIISDSSVHVQNCSADTEVVVRLVFIVGLAVAALANVPSSEHASQTLATFWQQMSLTQEFRQFTVFRQPAKL